MSVRWFFLRSLGNETRESLLKQIIAPGNIGVLQKLIAQRRHVIYYKIEAHLGVSFTNA